MNIRFLVGNSTMLEMLRNRLPILVALAAFVLVGACSPKVGSKEWCADMKEKPKGDWSVNEAKDFAKHCLL